MGHTLEVVGADVEVPLSDGRVVPYRDLDHAATTPALKRVVEAVSGFLPYYASVHRSAGWKSMRSSEYVEQARARVASFAGARVDDVVVFTRSTTDAVNILSEALPEDTTVVTFDGEHHANLLPWRRRRTVVIPTPSTRDQVGPALDEALGLLRGTLLVAVTGASNVTGDVWPVDDVVDSARRHGARVFVDAAQLAPHAPVRLAATGADWVAFSGHKMYAPFGAGALVGRRDWLEERAPLLRGGGAVSFVTTRDVEWLGAPARQEAGSPNAVGIVALGEACTALEALDMAAVAIAEDDMARDLEARLRTIDGIRPLRIWDDGPRIGVATFDWPGIPHAQVGRGLADRHGIAARTGCFCAHPLVMRLLGVPAAESARLQKSLRQGDAADLPGAVRVSTGLGTRADDPDALSDALTELSSTRPEAWLAELPSRGADSARSSS